MGTMKWLNLSVVMVLMSMFLCPLTSMANTTADNFYQRDTTIVVDTALPDIAFPLTVRKIIPAVPLRQLLPDSSSKIVILKNDTAIQVIETAGGVKLSFVVSDFEYTNGQTIHEQVVVTVRTMVTPADFISAHAPTISRGALLDLQWGFHIAASTPSKSIQLKKGKSIQITFPASTTIESLFYGDTLKTGAVNWMEAAQLDQLQINRLGWIAFGERYPNKQDRIDQYVKLDISEDYLLPEKATVLLVFQNKHIVASGISTEVPVLYSFRNMPIGEQVYAIAFMEVAGKLYVGKSDRFMVDEEDIPAIEMKAWSKDAIQLLLQQL
jgi:hypothetical protein